MPCAEGVIGLEKWTRVAFLLLLMSLISPAMAVFGEEGFFVDRFPPIEVHGFCEVRAGVRTQEDPFEKQISMMEARAQAELYTYTDWAEFKYKGDVWADAVTEKGEYDTREAWIFLRPTGFLDIKLGSQVLTWGTGDLAFVNDLFPKDWQSFFIGRDDEYLKAPSTAAKFGFFTQLANLDLVYTPRFDADRHITGEYISYWNADLGRRAGRDAIILTDMPDRWFKDDEIAARVYRTIRNYEIAVYGYWGFWKNPAGETQSGKSTFPELNVYGASARGQVGRGIGNVEFAYYHSLDDRNGSNPSIRNSEMRYLVGYAQEIAKELNGSLQYYIEQMLNYADYRNSLEGNSPRDRLRHVITLQVTKLSMNQNLELSLSTYFSPSDLDAYLRPKMHYSYTDQLTLEAGANVFFGDHDHTFFGQFEKNSSIYAAVRYSF